MNKRIGTLLTLTTMCGAIYCAVAANAQAQAETESQPLKPLKKPTIQLKRPRSTNGLKSPLPPLTKLDLKSLPPHAIPMEFNGGTVYWIPLNEKAPVKAKTLAR